MNIAPRVFLTCVALAVVSPCRAAPASGQQAGIWLQQRADELVRASVRTMRDGTPAFPPQAGVGTYEFFVLRDYAYLVEGCPQAFTKQELRETCTTFVNALRSDGAAVDLVTFDGTPYYKNGLGTMGDNPVADGSPFTVDVAWRTHQQLKDPAFLNQIIDPLVKTMNAAPRDPANGLIYIDPSKEWDRVPYGFTDCIRKSGDELFCSLLDIRASRQLGDLLSDAGRPTEAAARRASADAKTAAIRNTLWNPTTGLFNATTVRCNQPDIWGSAFAIQLGVATPEQSLSIANYLKDHYSEVVQAGQIRHLPGGTYWEAPGGCAPNTYQNGGFWGVATGWVVEALNTVDPQLAEQTVIDMVDNYQQNGVYEWVYAGGASAGARNYTSSATLPLPSIQKLYDVPKAALQLKEVGGTIADDNLAAASGAVAFAKDCLPGFDIHQIDHLNDGLQGNEHSWIAGSQSSFAGIALGEACTIGSLAIGRDLAGGWNDRYAGMFTFQYTRSLNPNEWTSDAEWITLGQWDGRFENDFGHLRHLYEFVPIAGVTGVRILIDGLASDSAGYVGIDEIEVYGVPEPGAIVLLAVAMLAMVVYHRKKAARHIT